MEGLAEGHGGRIQECMKYYGKWEYLKKNTRQAGTEIFIVRKRNRGIYGKYWKGAELESLGS